MTQLSLQKAGFFDIEDALSFIDTSILSIKIYNVLPLYADITWLDIQILYL